MIEGDHIWWKLVPTSRRLRVSRKRVGARNQGKQKPVEQFSDEASAVCTRRGWLGNVLQRWIPALDGTVIRASVRCAGSITLILETRSHLDLPAIRDALPRSLERRPGYPFLLVAVPHHRFVPATRLLSFQRFEVIDLRVFWICILIFQRDLSQYSGSLKHPRVLVYPSPVMDYWPFGLAERDKTKKNLERTI